MEELFLTVFNMSITAGYVILAVLLVRLLLKRAPKKYSYLLWSVVGFRLVCPLSFQSVFSLFSLRLFDLSKAQSVGSNTIQYVPQDVGMMREPRMTSGVAALTGTGGTIPLPAPQNAVQSANPMQLILAFCALLWCAGMAAMLLYSVVCYVRIRYRMRTAVLFEKNIYQSDKVCSPFILGFFRPRIYIPFGLEEEMLKYVLLHEQYHLKRKDHIIKLFAFLLLTVHWFNPLCWLSFVLMGKDMEMSCDEKVLNGAGNIRRLYSTALLSFAANRRFPAPGPLGFGESGVKGRIRNVLGWKKPKAGITVVSAALCAVMLVACAANPKKEAELESPFGYSYRVEEIVYDAPWYDFSYTLETAPGYRLTEDRQIAILGGSALGGEELLPAVLEEFTLTKDDFDNCFFSDAESGAAETADFSKLRRENKSAWRTVLPGAPNDVFYSIMQQKNGDLYLVYGYEASEESGHSSIRWLFKLARQDAESGVWKEKESENAKAETVQEMALLSPGSIASWDVSGSASGIELDLDGDGALERISLTGEGESAGMGAEQEEHYYSGGYTLQVDDQKLEEWGDYTERTIIGFTPDAKELLLGIYDEGPSADPITRFYRYDGSGLYAAGSIPGDIRTLQISQNGVIRCPCRADLLQTSFVWSYWYWNGTEIMMRQDTEYEFIHDEDSEEKLLLREPLQVYSERDESAEAVTMNPQEVEEIYTDLEEWVFLRGQDGTQGWLKTGLYTIPSLGDKETSEVFDGLRFFG